MEQKKNLLKGGVAMAALAVVGVLSLLFINLGRGNESMVQNVPEIEIMPRENLDEKTELRKEPVEVEEEGHAADEDGEYTSSVASTPVPAPAPAPAGDQYSYGEYWSYGDGLLEGLTAEMQEQNNEKIVSDLKESGAIMNGELMLVCSSMEKFVGEDGATYQKTTKTWRNVITSSVCETEEVIMIAAPAVTSSAMEVTAEIVSSNTIASEGAPAPAPQSEVIEDYSSEDSTASEDATVPAPGTVETVTVDGETFNIIW